jgi:hypothetical protein
MGYQSRERSCAGKRQAPCRFLDGALRLPAPFSDILSRNSARL